MVTGLRGGTRAGLAGDRICALKRDIGLGHGRARIMRRWSGARARASMDLATTVVVGPAPAPPYGDCGWSPGLRLARGSGGRRPWLGVAQICTSTGVALVFVAAQHFRTGKVLRFVSDIWTAAALEPPSCFWALLKHRRTCYSALQGQCLVASATCEIWF